MQFATNCETTRHRVRDGPTQIGPAQIAGVVSVQPSRSLAVTQVRRLPSAQMKTSAISVPAIPSVALSGTGQVAAIVVGIENYQQRGSGDTLPTVAFAREDAEGFSDVLKSIYPPEKLNTKLLRDSDATCTRLRDELLYTIKSLAPEDLFIFYYAGHGFYGAGGNRVTAWDTNLFNVEGTSLLLREVLSDQ